MLPKLSSQSELAHMPITANNRTQSIVPSSVWKEQPVLEHARGAYRHMARDRSMEKVQITANKKAALMAEAEKAFDPQRFSKMTVANSPKNLAPTRVSQLIAPSNDYSQSAFAPINPSF